MYLIPPQITLCYMVSKINILEFQEKLEIYEKILNERNQTKKHTCGISDVNLIHVSNKITNNKRENKILLLDLFLHNGYISEVNIMQCTNRSYFTYIYRLSSKAHVKT